MQALYCSRRRTETVTSPEVCFFSSLFSFFLLFLFLLLIFFFFFLANFAQHLRFVSFSSSSFQRTHARTHKSTHKRTHTHTNRGETFHVRLVDWNYTHICTHTHTHTHTHKQGRDISCKTSRLEFGGRMHLGRC